jgi:hypothetical protein
MEDIDTDRKDLVTTKRSKALPAAFVFGEWKVTADLIREYQVAGFFPAGSGRAPLDEKFLLPKPMKLFCFGIFSPAA